MKFLTALTLIALSAAAPLQGTGYFEIYSHDHPTGFTVREKNGQLVKAFATQTLFHAQSDYISFERHCYISVGENHSLYLVMDNPSIERQQKIVVQNEPGSSKYYLTINGDNTFILCLDGRIQFGRLCKDGEYIRLRFHTQL